LRSRKAAESGLLARVLSADFGGLALLDLAKNSTAFTDAILHQTVA
jgi:hypothetical protein